MNAYAYCSPYVTVLAGESKAQGKGVGALKAPSPHQVPGAGKRRIGADRGLGYLILTSSGAMKTSVMFGVLLILSALGIVSFYAVSWAERLLCPWYIPLDSDAPAAERDGSLAASEPC